MAKATPKKFMRDASPSMRRGLRERTGTGPDSGAELNRSKPRPKVQDKSASRAVRERREVKLEKERRKEKRELKKERSYSRPPSALESHHLPKREPSSETTKYEETPAKTTPPAAPEKQEEESPAPKQRPSERKGRLWGREKIHEYPSNFEERDAGLPATAAPGITPSTTGATTTTASAALPPKPSVSKVTTAPPSVEPSTAEPESTSTKGSEEDAINKEFIYFSAALRQLVSEMPASKTRRITVAWLRKLFSPEYHCPSLREKRNRYLMMLCGALLVGSPWGLLGRPPPAGPLPQPASLSVFIGPAAAWQRIDPWTSASDPDTHMAGDAGIGSNQGAQWGVHPEAADAAPRGGCSLHGPSGKPCPRVDERATSLLDDEFRLLTWLARPHVRALSDMRTRSTAAAWTRLLASVGPSACGILKGMRNDYALALLSHLADGQLHGPLATVPASLAEMLPLAEAARLAADEAAAEATCDLTAPEIQGFVRAQPRLENGAFCYVLVNL